MRYHLATQHPENDLFEDPKIILYPSLLDRLNRLKSIEKRFLRPEIKTLLDEAIVDAIVIDGRSHGDFRKKRN